MALPAGTYSVRLFVTEESFHENDPDSGDWATVMTTDDIAFTIPDQGTMALTTEPLDLDVTPAEGAAPLLVQALALGVEPGDACQWDFGDGTVAEGVLVDHTYTMPGSYTVTLRVGDRRATALVVVGAGSSPAEPPVR